MAKWLVICPILRIFLSFNPSPIMFELASPAYYVAMFGLPVLSLAFLGTFILLSLQAYRQRSRKHAVLSAVFGLILSLLANPISYLPFVPFADAQVAKMHQSIQQENFIGTGIEEFTNRFGIPDKVTPLQASGNQLLTYTRIPWFAYGWDELHVYADNGRITRSHIKD